jgi:hypothetical protein
MNETAISARSAYETMTEESLAAAGRTDSSDSDSDEETAGYDSFEVTYQAGKRGPSRTPSRRTTAKVRHVFPNNFVEII